MSISNVYQPDVYMGDGSTTTFPITFSFLDSDTNVKVSIISSAGVASLKTLNTDYTISGSNVVFETGHIPSSTDKVLLEVNPDFKQETTYPENGTFPAISHEKALDKLTIMAQLNHDFNHRAVSVSADTDLNGFDATLPPAVADGYIKLNSDGDGFETSKLSDTAGLGNIVEDTSPQLGGDLDANSFNVGFDSGTGIVDSSGNETLIFDEETDAVNYAKVTNSATGNPIKIEAKGDDDNIDINLSAKGTGAFNLTGDLNLNSSTAVDGFLDEDDMVSDSDTSLATQQSIKAYVDNKSATESDMTTATSTTTYVSPGVQKYHPTSAKFWVDIKDVTNSYNVASVTDLHTNGYSIAFVVPMADDTYALASEISVSGGGAGAVLVSKTTTGFQANNYLNTAQEDLNHTSAGHWVGYGELGEE